MKFVYTITVLLITLLSYTPNQASPPEIEQAVIPEIEYVRKLTLESKSVTDLRNIIRNQILSSAKNGKWSCSVNIQNFDGDTYNLIAEELSKSGYDISFIPENFRKITSPPPIVRLYPGSPERFSPLSPESSRLDISWRYQKKPFPKEKAMPFPKEKAM